jgi:hypothetical protein
MKIEFRKIPLHESEFSIRDDSVEFSGIFCKITSKLAKIEGTMKGCMEVDCCKCGGTFMIELDEKLDFLVSDGVYKS